MAYFRKRGKSWSYTADIGKDPVTGERRQVTKSGFRTKKEAEIAAARIEAEVADGTYIKETTTTFEDFGNTWLKLYKAGNPKVASIRQREYQLKALFKCFGKMQLRNITRKIYQETILDLYSQLARNTVLGIHAVGKMVFRKALEYGEIKIDPTEYAKVPAVSNDMSDDIPKYLEKEQLAEFLRLAKYRGLDMDYTVFLTLAYTGIRIGELCALKWSDIDKEASTISINGTLFNPDDISDRYDIVSPKTKTSRRTIVVDAMLIAELEAHRAKQNEFKMAHRKTYHDAGFVFGRMDDAYGYPPKRRTIERRMDRLTQWMNLPYRITPHSLRHTHTSLLAEAGVSLEAIMQRLGHAKDDTTRMVYLHVTKSLRREAADKFSALMSNVVKL